MHKVKLIRMQTGEDIMASMFEQEDSGQIQINDPMRIVFRRLPTGQTVMMMMPWLPVELIKENIAMIYSTDIITVVEPKESMIRYYDKLVERTISDMMESDGMIERLLEEQDADDEEDNEIAQEKMMEELVTSVQEVRNKKLH
jgi:hypothetical protein